MKTSKVLKLAKRYLITHHDTAEYTRNLDVSSYICVAISIACTRKEISEEDRNNAHLMIHRRLNGHPTFELWLREEYRISIYNCGGQIRDQVRAFRDKVQATRHAWVDSMIQEFAAKGD